MIDVGEARRRLLAETGPLGLEDVDLEAALGRVLAEDQFADRDQPPTDRSAMDGFAVRAGDLPRASMTLDCVGEVRAGQPLGPVRVEAGQTVRILTGAIVPPGADTVVMVEHTEPAADGGIRFLRPALLGQHIRRRGEDGRKGARVLEAGAWIQAPEIAALATVGRTRVPVHRLPRVHVLSTGDEVVEPELRPADHQVRNSNARTMLAQLRQIGVEGRYLGIASDARPELERTLEQGLAGDVLLITGGVSVGTYDLVRETLEAAGMRVLFHKVAMRPGKPVLAGRRGDCLVIGLPGNPVSAFTGLHVLVAPALRSLMGCRRLDDLRVRAVLSEPLPCKPGRTTYHLAWVEWRRGRWAASPVPSVSSGDVLSLARANAFLVTPAEAVSKEPGHEVAAFLWDRSHLRRRFAEPAG